MTAAMGRIAKTICWGLAGLLMAAALPSTAFAATPVTQYVLSPAPIAATSSLAASSTVSITVSAETATNSLVPGAVIYMSFTQAPGGGTAVVGATNLGKTPVAFTAATGTITVTYTAPAMLPTGGRDTIKAANAASLPSITATDSYDFVIYVFSPYAIAAPGSLAAGATVPVTLTAEDASAVAVPNATVYLSLVPAAGGGSAAVGATPLTSTPVAFVAGPTGQLVISYQTPIALPATGVDTITAQQSPTSVTRNDSVSYSFGALNSLAFSPSPIAAAGSLTPGQVVPVTLAAIDAMGNPVAGQFLFLTFVPVTNGGSAMYGTKALSATPIQVLTDAAGLVAITYTASSGAPNVGPDTLTAGNSKTSPTLSATDTYTGVQGSISGATYHALTPTRILDSRDGTGGLSGAFSSHVARTFTVIGHASVPSGAIAVTGNLTVTGQTNLGYLSIGPVAQNNPTSSTLNFPVNDDRANAVTVALGAGGTLSITYAAPTLGQTAHVIFDVTGYFTPDMTGATYHALSPTRILDSRDGTGGLSGAFSSHVARTFTVIGHASVPSGAIAVTGNLTVTGQTNLGYLSIGPVAQNNPTSSTLNFPVNDDRANAVTVALGAGGTLSITYAAPTLGQTAHVIFDVTGYFTPDASGAVFVPLTPTRVLDSRDGTGGLSGAFSSHVARTFTVIGHASVPSGAIAVTGNLTVTQQTSLGYLFIGPVAMNNPTSSTLNFPLNDDRANAVTVALSGTGTLSVTYAAPTLGKTAHVIFDVTGYFVP
jgi:hypothetical protein